MDRSKKIKCHALESLKSTPIGPDAHEGFYE